jgi:hypothetical protein
MNRLDRWQPRIKNARSAQAIVAVMREYVSSWTPEQVAQLPADCRPSADLDVQAVSQWAVELTRCELKFAGDAAAAELLHDVKAVFVQASQRLAQLTAESLGPSSDLR